MTAPNNPTPPLRDCSTGTTDQLEHLLRHLKKPSKHIVKLSTEFEKS